MRSGTLVIRTNGERILNGERIQKSKVQKDLGVVVQDSHQVNLQVELVIRKMNERTRI